MMKNTALDTTMMMNDIHMTESSWRFSILMARSCLKLESRMDLPDDDTASRIFPAAPENLFFTSEEAIPLTFGAFISRTSLRGPLLSKPASPPGCRWCSP